MRWTENEWMQLSQVTECDHEFNTRLRLCEDEMLLRNPIAWNPVWPWLWALEAAGLGQS